jgi:hypothetical protein
MMAVRDVLENVPMRPTNHWSGFILTHLHWFVAAARGARPRVAQPSTDISAPRARRQLLSPVDLIVAAHYVVFWSDDDFMQRRS